MGFALDLGTHDPQREPWDLPDLEPRDGLARLLAEARQWHKEDADGA